MRFSFNLPCRFHSLIWLSTTPGCRNVSPKTAAADRGSFSECAERSNIRYMLMGHRPIATINALRAIVVAMAR